MGVTIYQCAPYSALVSNPTLRGLPLDLFKIIIHLRVLHLLTKLLTDLPSLRHCLCVKSGIIYTVFIPSSTLGASTRALKKCLLKNHC